MSEFEPINEFESKEPGAVDRYYDYLDDAEGNVATVVVAVTELLSHLPTPIDLPVEAIFDANEYEAMLEVDERAMNESLVIMPLVHIGPLLERSNCSVEELAAWYDKVVRRVLHRPKQGHDLNCLSYDDGNPEHLMCTESTQCPHRFLDWYLSNDTWKPDFTMETYQANPLRARTIAIDKLALAQKYRIVLSAFHDATLHKYELEYEAYIDELMQEASLDIDYLKHI